jgi:hypothetical protein
MPVCRRIEFALNLVSVTHISGASHFRWRQSLLPVSHPTDRACEKKRHGLLDRGPHAVFNSASRLRPPAHHNSRAKT